MRTTKIVILPLPVVVLPVIDPWCWWQLLIAAVVGLSFIRPPPWFVVLVVLVPSSLTSPSPSPVHHLLFPIPLLTAVVFRCW
jgi:hypothetical protein